MQLRSFHLSWLSQSILGCYNKMPKVKQFIKKRGLLVLFWRSKSMAGIYLASDKGHMLHHKNQKGIKGAEEKLVHMNRASKQD